MTYQIILRYIRGIASEEETKAVMKWAHSDEGNMKELKDLQHLHDTLLWHESRESELQEESSAQPKVLLVYLRRFVAAACIVAVSLLASWLYFRKDGAGSYRDNPVSVSVPDGQQVYFVLPDSTKVWAEPGSRISFPVRPVNGSRLLSLDGEAFFDVHHSEKYPFIVNTNQYRIKVTGTEFRVRAYSHSPEWEVALLRGSVEIVSKDEDHTVYRLKPNMRAMMRNGRLTVDTISNPNNYQCYEGIICFDNNTLEEIFNRLSHYYGVKFNVSDKHILSDRYTGKFRLRDGISHIMHTLQLGSRFTYHVYEEDRTVSVY